MNRKRVKKNVMPKSGFQKPQPAPSKPNANRAVELAHLGMAAGLRNSQ